MRARGARWGPILWVSCVQYFAVQVAVASDWARRYSWSGNTISDLGNTRCADYAGRPVCSPLHLAMNVSFVVLGLTMIGGALLIGRELATDRATRAGFACLVLAGLGTLVVGLFPENTVSGLHVGGAALPFVFGNLGVLLLGLGLPGLGLGPRAFTLCAGVVGLVGLPLFLTHTYLGLGAGGMERVTAYPQDIWLVVFAACLLGPHSPRRLAARPPRGLGARSLRRIAARSPRGLGARSHEMAARACP